jgi:hypothetical protein
VNYNRVETFLSTLTYADLQNGTFPASTDTTGVRAATGNIEDGSAIITVLRIQTLQRVRGYNKYNL